MPDSTSRTKPPAMAPARRAGDWVKFHVHAFASCKTELMLAADSGTGSGLASWTCGHIGPTVPGVGNESPMRPATVENAGPGACWPASGPAFEIATGPESDGGEGSGDRDAAGGSHRSHTQLKSSCVFL